MNKSILSWTIFAIAVVVLVSCHKKYVNPMLNIIYPAAYVVNGSSNNISVINLTTNTVTETIELNRAKFPHHIYINPSQTKLAVAITSKDLSGGHAGHGGAKGNFKVQIIDAVSGNIEKEIVLERLPHNAIFNTTGNELWVGQSDDNKSQVLIYSTSDWSLNKKIDVGKGLSEITFSANGTIAFACNTTDGTVSIIDVNSKTVETTLTVGKDPVGAWTASNGNMYVDNETSQTISEISVAGRNVTQTINLNFKPAYVAYNSSNNELWVSDASNGKVVFYTQVEGTWTMKGNIPTGADAHAIVFNADQSNAYVTNQGAGTISIIDVASHAVIQTITVGKSPNGIVLKQ